MNIIVCVKQVRQYKTFSAFDLAGKTLMEEGRFFLLNPCDENALEAGLRIKESLGKGSVTAISLGPERVQSVLRWCLAMGADEAIHLVSEKTNEMSPWTVAEMLADTISRQKPDIILFGRASLDHGSGRIGTFVAELLTLPVVTAVAGIEIDTTAKQIRFQRMLERGDRETGTCPIPAVLTVDRALNRPRYPTLPGRIRAEKAHIEKIQIPDTEDVVDLASSKPAMTCEGLAPPKIRPKKILAPDSNLSAAGRLKFIMSGGAGQKAGSKVGGDPEQMAQAIFDFLKEKHFISSEKK